MQETSDLLAQRLNFDPAVFCGCTMKEMQIIGVNSLIICILLLGLLTKCILDMFMVGVGLAFPLAVGMSWGMALMLQQAKYGKPKGHVKQRFLLWCEDKGLTPAIYTRRSGRWSVGRKR